MGTSLSKILIVEDEPLEQKLIFEILEEGGMYEVKAVSSGEDALLTLSAFNPDIILLDVEMAGMDGYAVCREIRANADYHFTKIIMVSGHASVDARLHGYEAGADDFITKPFEGQEFLAKIKVYARLKHKEEVDKVKGDLLTLLTHETMTPINGILGCAEILLVDSVLTEGQRELVTMMVAAGSQLNRFLQNAVLLSKLRAGLALTMSRELVVPLLEKVVAECAMGYEEKDIQFSVCGRRGVDLEADWPLLRYALVAIISNAMKFSPQGGLVTVEVGARKGFCQIIIDDQGCGVDRERKECLFEDFSVFDVTHHQSGQGLSMAISQRICNRHGGDIGVVDNPAGVGSRFVVTIPLEITMGAS